MKDRCKRLSVKVWFVLMILVSPSIKAQTLLLDSAAFVQATYAPGNDIAVLFSTQGCFGNANVFQLVLSDANGQFGANAPVIGTHNGYYATFLNGILPANAGVGSGYRLRLQSTQPALSVLSPAFSIANAPVVRAAASVAQPLRVLRANYAYGFCTNPIVPQQLSLADNSTAGATVTARLKDDLTQNLSATYQYNAGTTNGVALDRSYYSYLIRSERNGVVATRAYALINSRNRIILGVDGEQQGCLPQELEFQIGMDASSGGIEHNYPGTEYLVEWGDATSTTYRLCDLIAANGVLRHSYNNTSCNRPGVTYNITVSVIQPWASNAGCDRPQVTTRAKISKRPKSMFVLPDTGCLGTNMLIRNISDPGQQVFGTLCVSRADYFWYVNGTLVSAAYDRTPAQANLNYAFTQPGINTVRLVVDNQGCMESDSTQVICITARPVANLSTSQGSDTISGCAPFTLQYSSLTSLVSCRPTSLRYEVRDGVTQAILAPNTGIYTADSLAMQVQFLQPGRYLLIQRATNFCGASADTLVINVAAAPQINWKPIAGRCDTGLLILADAAVGPQYTLVNAATQFTWSVNGPAHQYAAGFGANDAAPSIRLLAQGQYQLMVQATNACGTSTATQVFTVQPAPMASLGQPSASICYADSVPALLLQTNVASIDSIVWSSTGTGIFSGAGAQNTYLASQQDRVVGTLQLQAMVYSSGLFCAGPVATMSVTIKPNPGRASRAIHLCNGAPLAAALPTAASLTYTSTSSAWLSGISASGSGYPQDLIVNTSSTLSGQALYTFVATENGCNSAPFTDTFYVYPTPMLSLEKTIDTICSGALSQLPLQASVPAAFRWSVNAFPANAAIGFSPQPVGVSTGFIAQPLQLLSAQQMATVVYQIQAVSTEGCLSNEVTASVVLKPGNSAALAGPDQLLCQATQATLAAAAPSMGTGVWSLVGGQGQLVQPQQPIAQINGLQPNDTVVAVYTVGGFNGCAANTDTVRIISRPGVGTVDAGQAIPSCLFAPGTLDSIALLASAPAQAYETGQWTVLSTPTAAQAAVVQAYSPATTLVANAPGRYLLQWSVGNDAGCPQSSDTVAIHIYAKPEAPQLILPAISCSADTTSFAIAGGSGSIYAFQLQTAGMGWHTLNTAQQLPPSADTQYLRAIVRSEGFAQGCALADTSSLYSLPRVASTVAGQLLGADTVCSGANAGLLQLSQATGMVNAWQFSLDGGNTWQTQPASGSSLAYQNLVQTTLYRAEVQSNICPARFTPPVAVTVHGGIASVSVLGHQSVCAGTAASPLQASVQTNGFGGIQHYWEESSDSVQYQPVNAGTQLQLSPGVLAGTRWYRLQANASVCGSNGFTTSQPVRVEVLPVAQAGFALAAEGCAPFALQPTHAQPAHESLSTRWFINGRLVSAGGFPGHTLTMPADTARLLLKVESTRGCGTDSFSAVATTLPLARPRFDVPAFNACGPVNITLQNQTQHSGGLQFQWAYGNGQFSSLAQPGSMVFDAHPLGQDTSYAIILKAMNACDTGVYSQPLLVKSKPVVTFSPDKTTGCSPFTVQLSNTTYGVNNYQWQFGDGSNGSTHAGSSLSHTYRTGIADTFFVQLRAQNSCGTDSLRYALVVQPSNLRIDMAVNGNEAAGCAPFAVKFINNSQHGQQFRWDFGDGQQLQTIRNLDTVLHTFQQPGSYQVRLQASNACTDTSTTETIFIGRSPVASIGAHLGSLCLGDTLALQASSDSAQSYQWLAGAQAYTQASVQAIMQRQGMQPIRLMATRGYNNGLQCTDTVYSQVLVNAVAPGKMTISDTVGLCGPLTVRFAHAYAQAQTRWRVSGGQQFTGDSARFTFAQNGVHWVLMQATSAGGCIRTDSVAVRLQSPTGSASYNTKLSCGPVPVLFQAQYNGADSIKWLFGDGNTVTTTQGQTQHTYQARGSYLPQAVLVANGGQCLLPLPLKDTIVVDRLNAGFSWTAKQDCGFTTLAFRDTIAGQQALQHEWWFGNGQQSRQAIAQAVYSSTNPYLVKLKLTAGTGCTDSAQVTIPVSVFAQPRASILANAAACAGTSTPLQSVVNSADSILKFQWWSATGLNSSFRNAQYTPAQPGLHPVRLIVTTIHACADTATLVLNAQVPPQIRASEDASICKGDQISLMASGATQYTWSPANNLSCINCAVTQTTTPQTRRYVVTGTVPGNACAGSDTVWVRVAQPFSIEASQGDSICRGEVAQLSAGNAYRYQWWPATGLSSSTVAAPLASPAATTRYRVIGRDSAGCFTDTAYVQVAVGRPMTLSLGADRSAATGDRMVLQTSHTGDAVAQWKWSGQGLSCTDCAQPTLTVQGNTQVMVQARSVYGCTAQDTLEIKGFCENTQVFIANAFTPDKDGRNDYLYVQGKGIAAVRSFRVYNRWGQVVFERTNMAPNDARAGWDGTIRGIAATTDVYVYTAEVVCNNNVAYTYKGNTTLIR